MEVIAYCDGGVSHNQTPEKRHGYGSFSIFKDGEKLITKNLTFGNITNNQAEYLALLYTLDYCVKEFLPNPVINTDSELLVSQLNGTFKTKNEKLKELQKKAVDIIKLIDATVVKVERSKIVEVLGH